MRFPRKRGSTSNMVRVFIPDNTVTNGAGCTGLTSASTNLTIAFVRSLDGAATTYTGANIEAQTTIGTFQAPSTSSKVRFKAVDATSFPGLYELQFHDSAAAFGSGDASDAVEINIYEATTTALKIGPNMALIPLVPWDYQDGVRMGLTALPNAVAAAANGLLTFGTGTGQINPSGGSVPISSGVKKNQALAKFEFLMTDSTTHAPKTGLGAGVTAQRSLDGAAFGACTNAAAELANGIYTIDLAAGDLNANVVTFRFTAAGSDDTLLTVITQP